MKIDYLKVLPSLNNYRDANEAKHLIIDIDKESKNGSLLDTINFNNADSNYDDLLTYEELKNIKLSVDYDVKKDSFKLVRGLGLLDKTDQQSIVLNNKITFKELKEAIEKLDKNNDSKIESNEIESDLNQFSLEKKRSVRIYKLNEIRDNDSSQKEDESMTKQIQALDKQIESLKKTLQKLTTQKASQSSTANAPDNNSNEALKYMAKSIDKYTDTEALESKYSKEDVSNVINEVKRVKNVENNIDAIKIATDTQLSSDEIVSLSDNISSVDISQADIEQTRDMSALQSFSPAATPVNIDKKNIDFTIDSIKQKIADLEDAKSEISQKMMEKQFNKLDILG
jgi:hypothetical protein